MEQINDTVKFTWRTSFPLPGISRATPVLYHTDEILLSERRALHVFFTVLCHIIQFYRLIIVKKGRTHWSAPTEEEQYSRSPYSLSSLIAAVLSQKETGFIRVETLVSILLPTAVGTANSCAPQSATLRLIKTQKNPAEKTSAGFIMLFQ